MTRYWLSAALLATLSLSAGLGAAWALPGAPSLADEKAAVLKVEELVANAQTPELGLSCFDPDALQDDFFPPQRHGVKQINEDFKVYMDNFNTFHADIKDMTIQVNGDLAVAMSHQHFTAHGSHGNANMDIVVRQTDVLHKKNGKWLITYQHLSVPVDILTGKAQMKLPS